MKANIFLLSILTSSCVFASQAYTIGVVLPMQHEAMAEIVNGFKSELKAKHLDNVKLVVNNAQNDMNLEQSIMHEYKQNPNIDMIAPVGTTAFEMALNDIQSKPIVGVAADYTVSAQQKRQSKNVTDVLDEVSVSQQMQFIKTVMPSIKEITLLHSADDRIFDDVKKAKVAGNKMGIKVQDLMVTELPQLYTVAQHLDPNTQAIFILKDHPIVSGIQTLTNTAKLKHIPVISSDDGSVQRGADFAIGVSEFETGVDAADQAAKVINGQKVGAIPVMKMTKYDVFINKSAPFSKANLAKLKSAASASHYNVKEYA